MTSYYIRHWGGNFAIYYCQAASSSEITALTEEVKKLTTLVEQYGERIVALETKMADYENTVLNANEEEWEVVSLCKEACLIEPLH